MAIVKMKKFNLYSFETNRDLLLKNLQRFKYVHFNNLDILDEEVQLEKVHVSDEVLEIDEEIAKADWTIKLLSKFEKKKSSVEQLKDGLKSISLDELYQRAKDFDFTSNYESLYELSEEKALIEQKIQSLNAEIAELKPWKDIGIPICEIESFKGVRVKFGNIATKYLDGFLNDLNNLELTTVDIISQSNKLSYLIVLSDESESESLDNAIRDNGFSQMRIRTEKIVSESIDEISGVIENHKEEIEIIDKAMREYVNYLEDFRLYYDYLRNTKLRLASSENFLKTEKVDIIEGYVPKDREKDFTDVLKKVLGNEYYIDIRDAEKDDDKVPIILKNNKFAKDFESLTQMYSLPRYNEIDPTPLFAPFYFIFAGIMVGDFGYGLLLFLGTLFALKKFNLQGSKRNFFKFFNYVGISTMIWGFIFGSCFGDAIKLPGLIDIGKDYMDIIVLSIVLGAIHIFFALGIKAYMDIRDNKVLDAIYDVGFWYVALITTAVVLMPKIVPSVVISPGIMKIAKIFMILSFIGIIATGGRENKGIGARFAWGLYSLYGITSYLGDLVSYLRLMALALAGSFIAVAVNIIVRMLLSGGIFGIIAGIIIFTVFQLFNMFLSFLSAYVHSARLTYVEMFNKFYEGGGVPFKTMVENSKYFVIKED